MSQSTKNDSCVCSYNVTITNLSGLGWVSESFPYIFLKKNYNKPIAINAIIKKERENVKTILK